MANLAELDRVIAHCAANPEQHDQVSWFDIPAENWTDTALGEDILADNWRCHTTACLAGWAAILNGWRPKRPDTIYMINDDGQAESVITVARQVLDLTSEQADELFAQADNLDDIRRVVERIRAEQTEAAS